MPPGRPVGRNKASAALRRSISAQERRNTASAYCALRSARSPRHQNLARKLIPALLGRAHSSLVARQRRDVDRSVLHVAATGAWKESLTEGSRSRRSGLTGSGKAPVMAGSRCPPSVAQGAIATLQRWGGAGSQSMAQVKNRRTRVPKGNPRDREVPGEPKRLSRRPARVSWGRHKRPPGCRSRHPRPVAPSRGFPAGRTARARK